jgi:hypothetical protein
LTRGVSILKDKNAFFVHYIRLVPAWKWLLSSST